MINLHLFATFILAVTALMLLPGPNVALITSNTVSHGVRYCLLTVAGTSAAMLVQLTVTALGMGAVIAAAGPWFAALRWLGTTYLVFLGIQAWRQPASLPSAITIPVPYKIFRRALVVSLTNPKTLFFYGAFFPQFISPYHPILPQLGALSAAFITIALVIDGLWALTAHHARRWLSRTTWPHRASGTILIGAGVTLAFARGR